MRWKVATICLLLSGLVGASDRGLDAAVEQVQRQTEGRVLSAQTRNGQHEVKVLLPDGTVRIVRSPAAEARERGLTPPARSEEPPRRDNRSLYSRSPAQQRPAVPNSHNIPANNRRLHQADRDIENRARFDRSRAAQDDDDRRRRRN